nr:hypothetical protein [Tanacetum cinerariifolium]
MDNCKKGLGYNAVPPPHTGLFMPPKLDLSYIDLEEFTSEAVVETLNVKTSKDVHKDEIDNGCSRHITGNRSYLIDNEEIDEGEVQIHALVDGMKCLSPKQTAWNEFSSTTASAIICLGFFNKQAPLFSTMVGPNQVQMGEGSAQPTDTQHTPTFDMPPPKPKKTKNLGNPRERLLRATATASGLKAEHDSGNIYKTQTKATSNEPSSQGTSSGVNTPRSDEDRLEHIELMKICTTLQKKVLDLEDELKRTKIAQQTKIDDLERTLDKEDTSKQGRIDEIDADEDIALVSTYDDVTHDDVIVQDKGIEDVGEKEVVEVVTTAKMSIDVVVDAAQVTTAIVDIPVSAADTIVTTAPTITAEYTKTNVKVTQASKRKGVMIQEPEKTTTTKTASLQQSKVQDKAKGKAKLTREPEIPKKRKHQTRANEELAVKLQAKINEEDRLARETAQKKQEANDALINTWDDI